MKELERENAFYKTHRNEFREKYYNKYLLITGETLQGTYDKFAEAAKVAFENFEPGKFLIHKPSDEDRIIEIGPFISTSNPVDNTDENNTSGIICVKGKLKEFSYAY